jgi:HPt (histidine-containing phosphotransfer) domain-containing protein
MDAFVAKPFAVDELIAVIQRLTGVRPQVAAPAPVAAPPAVIEEAFEGIAVQEAQKVWQDLSVYRRFLAKFARDNADSMARLRELIEQGDTKQAGALVHKLKGSAGNLSLTELARAAGQIEHKLMDGEDAGADLPALHVAFAQACRSIAAYTAGDGSAAAVPASTTPIDVARARALLEELLTALDRDNPDLALPVLHQLDGLLPRAGLDSMRASVDDFDFRRAEQSAREIAAELREHRE